MWPQRQDRGGGVRRGLSDMREEEEFDAASATCARRRLTLMLTLTLTPTLTLALTLTLPLTLTSYERGGGVRCGLSDMREEEGFDSASAT